MINRCKQNVDYKPFEWSDLMIILQFDFCPRCRYFESCYDLDILASEYDGTILRMRGAANFISIDCGKDLVDNDEQ